MSGAARKLLVMGLPGAGKTTLAELLVRKLSAVHFNGDALRLNVNMELGFSSADRIEQARRMGWLADQVVRAGHCAVCDFVCPTAVARMAFEEGGPAFVVWVDRIAEGRFVDTNRLFQAPEKFDVRVLKEGSPAQWAERVLAARIGVSLYSVSS